MIYIERIRLPRVSQIVLIILLKIDWIESEGASLFRENLRASFRIQGINFRYKIMTLLSSSRLNEINGFQFIRVCSVIVCAISDFQLLTVKKAKLS